MFLKVRSIFEDEIMECDHFVCLFFIQVLVIDFGAEMYVWIGKQSPKPDRVTALRQAEELWSQGYNYSAFKINPMSPFLGNLEKNLSLLGKLFKIK